MTDTKSDQLERDAIAALEHALTSDSNDHKIGAASALLEHVRASRKGE